MCSLSTLPFTDHPQRSNRRCGNMLPWVQAGYATNLHFKVVFRIQCRYEQRARGRFLCVQLTHVVCEGYHPVRNQHGARSCHAGEWSTRPIRWRWGGDLLPVGSLRRSPRHLHGIVSVSSPHHDNDDAFRKVRFSSVVLSNRPFKYA